MRKREALVRDALLFQVDRVHSARWAGSLGELRRDDSSAGPNIKDLGTKKRAFLLENPVEFLGLAAPRVEVATGVAGLFAGIVVHESRVAVRLSP